MRIPYFNKPLKRDVLANITWNEDVSDRNKRHDRLTIASKAGTIIFLLASLTISLLPLLPPTAAGINLFSITPDSLSPANSTLINGSPLAHVDAPLPFNHRNISNITFGSIPSKPPLTPKTQLPPVERDEPKTTQDLDSTRIAKSVKAASIVVVGGEIPPRFGPRDVDVLVGVMNICSKPSHLDEITCTSASEAAYHAALLPMSLGDPLVALPRNPPTPGLLLICAAGLVLAFLAYALPLLPWTALLRPFKSTAAPRWLRARRLADENDPEATRDLVAHPEPPKPIAFNWTFMILIIASFALALAATCTQLITVSKTMSSWNKDEARLAGLEMKIGGACYLLGVLPVMMLITMITALIPIFLQYRSRKSQASTSAAPKTPMMKDKRPWSVLEDQPAGVTAPPVAKSTEEKSGRQSWRGTFGQNIGQAV